MLLRSEVLVAAKVLLLIVLTQRFLLIQSPAMAVVNVVIIAKTVPYQVLLQKSVATVESWDISRKPVNVLPRAIQKVASARKSALKVPLNGPVVIVTKMGAVAAVLSGMSVLRRPSKPCGFWKQRKKNVINPSTGGQARVGVCGCSSGCGGIEWFKW